MGSHSSSVPSASAVMSGSRSDRSVRLPQWQSQSPFEWRGSVENEELNRLHPAAFDTRVYSDDEWGRVELLNRHSLGWVVARDNETLVGFVNVLWDGLIHAGLQDKMVSSKARHSGVGTEVVRVARQEAKAAGCE